MTDSASDNNSSLHMVESGSSVSLKVGKVKSFPGRGVGHLFLHLLTFSCLSSVYAYFPFNFFLSIFLLGP